MPGHLTRILSDIHYGDRASIVGNLGQLQPLTESAACLVLNGDTLDTRAGPLPAHTQTCREEVQAFAASLPEAVLISGNHDPDLVPKHMLELAGGQVIVTHGDVLFDDIVPWGRDAHLIRRRIAAALAARVGGRLGLDERFAIWRAVAATIPQRHQSERNPLKYAVRFAADTVWPPLRIVRILRAWKRAPSLAADFAREHWPGARFIVIGHTHRPGVWSPAGGPVVINTGSFCPPLGGFAVDIEPARLQVRQIQRRGHAFHADRLIATFAL
ncbi:MAG: hypothetical protein Q7S40_23665 [Opitutaceae bacterium]|nr:hypothetical protein [Opitutaceae bacterium]